MNIDESKSFFVYFADGEYKSRWKVVA